MNQSEWNLEMERDMWEAAIKPERLAFGEWKRLVNARFLAMVGLTASDLADQPYRDWWEEGVSPLDAVRWTLENEGWEVGEEE